MADEKNKKNDEENESEVLEFEFNEDGEEDLKKTIKKNIKTQKCVLFYQLNIRLYVHIINYFFI